MFTSLLRRYCSFFLIDWLYKFLIRNDLAIFNYHEISNIPSKFSEKYDLCVSPETFKKQINFIRKYYNIITPKELLTDKYKRPAAIITFDDGFKSTFMNGVEYLSDLGIPSIVFINMAPIKGEIFWVGLITYLCDIDKHFQNKMTQKYKVSVELLYLFIVSEDIAPYKDSINDPFFITKVKEYYGDFASEEDLIDSNSKGVYLGNHLYNHYNAARISKPELISNYVVNNSILNRYKNSINFFSYPYGQPNLCYTDETHAILFSLGAKKIFTAYSLPNSKDNCNIYHRIPMFEYISNENLFKFNSMIPSFINKYLN
jgi:peptidoglycan/xylan/chitin deacetylase (PgdA/CDA1 family)